MNAAATGDLGANGETVSSSVSPSAESESALVGATLLSNWPNGAPTCEPVAASSATSEPGPSREPTVVKTCAQSAECCSAWKPPVPNVVAGAGHRAAPVASSNE